MRRIVLPLLLSASLLGGCDGGDSVQSGAQSTEGPFRVLVFSRTTGFRHASIETGVATVRELGQANGFETDHTEDPAAFTADNLARYAAVVWLSTTGTVLDTAEQRTAFEQYIAAGGGYAGVHSAADTEYDWPFYATLVGAYFKNHPVFPIWATGGPGVQPADLYVEAPDHPAVAHLPVPWNIADEFYAFRENPRGQVRVLLNIDESTYEQYPNTSNLPTSPTFPLGESGSMGDHPMSWCHDRLGGRAWYTALGHSEHMYASAEYRQHLLNGILTAARRVSADCTPGLQAH